MWRRTLRNLAATIGALTLAVVPAVTAAADGREAAAEASVNEELTAAFGHYGDTAGRWTGADSAYSVPLPGGRTAWLYSDTFLGTVNADRSRPESSPFIHNSIIVEDRGRMTTHTGGTAAAPESLVTVPGGDEARNWYWFADGTVEGLHLQVMLLEFEKTGDGVFDFAFRGTAIASFDLRTLELVELTEADPARSDSPIHWGSALHEEGRWTYVYGVEDNQSEKYAHLARVPRGKLTTGAWEYYDGQRWTRYASRSARILEGVSNEFSVHCNGKSLVLVTGDARQALSADIVRYESTSVVGPFSGPELLYRTPETGGNIFTYNAKAHPQLGGSDSDGQRLLITYNVNSFDTDDVYADVDNYRPRYVDVLVG